MAKSCARFQPVKPGSEEHNRRLKNLDYVRTDLSKSNQSWSIQSISSRLADIKQLVKTKTGRSLQNKATPIREAVVLIKPGTTMEDLKKLATAYKEKFGINVFQIDIHKDEGHEDVNGQWVGNLHAHLTADFINHDTGKSLKLNRLQMSQLQDVTAEVLDMERGVSSNKQHLDVLQFKIKAERERLEELQKKIGPGAKLAAFFKVGELAEIRSALQQAQNTAETAEQALHDANKAHTDELATEKEKSRQSGYKEAISDVKKAASLHITGKDGKETAEDIGKAWRWNFDQRKQLQSKVEEQLKSEKQRKDPIETVNGLLSLLNISKVATLEDIEEVRARLQNVRNVESFWSRERNELCAAIMAWGDQKECDINSPKALQLLQRLYEAMRDAWNALVSTARKIAAEHVLQPEYIFRNKDLVDIVNLQLQFTPGACFRYTSGWEEALTMGAEKYLAPFKERIDQRKQLQSMQQEQQDIEQDIEEEKTRQNTWHR